MQFVQGITESDKDKLCAKPIVQLPRPELNELPKSKPIAVEFCKKTNVDGSRDSSSLNLCRLKGGRHSTVDPHGKIILLLDNPYVILTHIITACIMPHP